MKLENKVAIVTGSSRGIGKAIAIDFAKEGATVVVAARTETESGKLPGTIYETAEEIKALGGKVLPLRCNVADEDSIKDMVAKVMETFGKVDILVNNAAVAYYRPFMEIDVRYWDLVFRVNTRGPFLCTQAVLPHMIEQKSGNIVNITSTAATNPYSIVAREEGKRHVSGLLYGASKSAVNRMTQGLAIELAGHNIAVNALAPAVPTYSEGVAMWNPDVSPDKFRSPHLFMTKAAIFLASQNVSGITGGIFLDEDLCDLHNLT